MLVQTTPIGNTTKDEYDAFLASGWFRGNGIIYRTEIVCISERIFSVQHIRIPLKENRLGKRHRKLLKKNADIFHVTIGEPHVNDRKEELYRGHSRRFKAFIHQTLTEIIANSKHQGEFETKELCVYLGDKLVAVSYFDLGRKSMASIMCLYDQDYRAYSLGIYTMLLEMEIALHAEVDYYYPGYILDMPSSFDYKLSAGKCQWMGSDGKWYSESDLPEFVSKGQFLREKMAELKAKITQFGYDSVFKIYPYYTVGQVMWDSPELFRLPCFFTFVSEGKTIGASYDPVEDIFVIFDLLNADEHEFSQHLELSDDYKKGEIYELRFLKNSYYMPFSDATVPRINNREKSLVK